MYILLLYTGTYTSMFMYRAYWSYMIDSYTFNIHSIVLLYRYMLLLEHFFMCFTYNTIIFFDNTRRYLEYSTTNAYLYYKGIRRQLSISLFFLFSVFYGPEGASAGDDEPRAPAPSWCQQQLRIINVSLPKIEEIVQAMQERSNILLGHCQTSQRFIIHARSIDERVLGCLRPISTSRVLYQEATARHVNPVRRARMLRNEYLPEASGLLRIVQGGSRRLRTLVAGQILESSNTTSLLRTCLATLHRMAQWHMQVEERTNNLHPEDTQQPESAIETQALKEKLQEFKEAMRVCYENGVNLTMGCSVIYTLLANVESHWNIVTGNAAALEEEIGMLEQSSEVSQVQMRDFIIRQQQQRDRISSTSSSSSGLVNSHSMSSAISTGRSDSTAHFIQGYDVEGTMCSLQGVHSMLGSATNHMSILLKQLLAKGCSTVHPSMRNGLALGTGHSGIGFISRNTKNTSRFRMAGSNVHALYTNLSTGHMFSSLTGAPSTIGCNTRSTQAGYMLPLTSKVTVGLAYEYRHNNVQETPYIQYKASSGGVMSRTNATLLSGMASWNTDTIGFTGQMVGCYGWGTMQTRRYSLHKEHIVAAKGRPNIHQKGGAIRLGYILPSVKDIQLTPYVEYMLASSAKNAYKENSGPLLHMISGHKEHVFEKSIGVLSRWTIDDCSHLQTWITRVFSRRNATELQSQPLCSALPLYKTVIPSNKSKNIQNEIGVAYEMTFREVAKITLNGALRLGKTRDMIDKHMQLTVQYMY